jgi:hypothetical protein
MTGKITPKLFRMVLMSFEIPLSLWRILIILNLGCQAVLKPCPASLLRFPFLLRTKLVARKQGRCAQKASAGKRIHSEVSSRASAECGGPIGRPAARLSSPKSGRPCIGIPLFLGKERLAARPKKRGAPYGFCAQGPCFRAGRCLKFNRANTYLPKSEGGKVLEPCPASFLRCLFLRPGGKAVV